MKRSHARLILFDVDGTLIDAGGAGRRAMERAFERVFGVESLGARASGVRYAGMTDPRIVDAVGDVLNLDRDHLEQGRAALEHSYLEALEEEMARTDPRRRVMPGVLDLLHALDARDGVRLGLLTGNSERGTRIKLAAFGLNDFFPHGGFSSDHADRREIARVAWRRMSELAGIAFEPGQVVVVGDTEQDVACARANAFRAVAVDSGWAERAAIEREQPDALLDSLEDTARVIAALGLS